LVYDQKLNENVKRTIYAGEDVDAQLVSFKVTNTNDNIPEINNVSCIPNPFTYETTLSFHLTELQYIEVEIYNIHGTKIKTLMAGEFSEGRYSTIWCGDDDFGKSVLEGVYMIQITTKNGNSYTDKIVLIK